MLDAIPIHEFVATQHMTAFATTSSYNKDCVLMHGKDMTGPDTMRYTFVQCVVLCCSVLWCVAVYSDLFSRMQCKEMTGPDTMRYTE